MTNYQQAQMTRNTGTCVFLAANTAATTGDTAFIAAATKMETDTASADIAADAAAADNTGYSVDKLISKDEVGQMAAELCARSIVQMIIIGNNAVKNSLKSAVSYYLGASDAVCVTRLMSVYNVMNTNLLLITPEYLTAAQLVTFLGKINSFRTMKGSTTFVNTNMPVLTAQLKTDLAQTSLTIASLKLLSKKYKTTNTLFYDGLWAACKMPPVAIRHTPLTITLVNVITGEVVAGVQGTLTKSKQLPISSVAGIMLYTNVQGGKATGTFAKPGFETKIVEMPIASGKANNFFVNLTPGTMTVEKEAAIQATLATIIATEKAEKAAKAIARKEAKAAADLLKTTVVEVPVVVEPKTASN